MEKIGTEVLINIFPEVLFTYFDLVDYAQVCVIKTKEEEWIFSFREKNQLPDGFDPEEYESKGFVESKEIQDFPLRGRAVYLRLQMRRWRHKETGKTIKRDYKFIAEGSKLTKELSDFLKENH